MRQITRNSKLTVRWVIDKTLSDIELGALLSAPDAHADSPLVFRYDGRDVKAGYHVTEVKTGRFDALGFGGNPESWTEIFVQLWDIDEDGRTHMSSRADRRWPRDCGARSSPGKLQASRPAGWRSRPGHRHRAAGRRRPAACDRRTGRLSKLAEVLMTISFVNLDRVATSPFTGRTK